ncbi:unnamed protein product [Cylindrotheca closterium]|uniref:Sulfotransferase n=1 Tax=Cylindrotheca closterium TaxID=2856 RepID=A0AAD2FXZ2_9STRA|nr:unnamed protein product [Cylindrotheca closterium]
MEEGPETAIQNDEETKSLISTRDVSQSDTPLPSSSSSQKPLLNSSKTSQRWLLLFFVLLLLLAILFVTDRMELFRRDGNTGTSLAQSPSIPQDSQTKLTNDEIRTQRLQLMKSYNFSNPSAINYTSLVQYLGLARVFQPNFKSSESAIPPWCTYDEAHHPSNETGTPSFNRSVYASGILYNKMPKAASSTLSGIVLRIAHNVAKRFGAQHPCTSFQHHIEAEGNAKRLFEDRDVHKSFLFSSIRDPAAQAISHIYFRHISRRNQTPSDENMMKFLMNSNHQNGVISKGVGGFQIEYLAFERLPQFYAWNRRAPTRVIQPIHVHQVIQEILANYDYFISVERFDESLVALQLLLGLETSEILYISSKKAGGSYSYSKGKGCFFLQKPKASDAVAAYLASDEWYAKQYGDYVLMEVVKQSLDLTIEYLGESRFDRALKEFRAMKRDGEGECADKATFPCSDDGEEQLEAAEKSCYSTDWGCGYACLDSLSSDDTRT